LARNGFDPSVCSAVAATVVQAAAEGPDDELDEQAEFGDPG
jgi:hypothetical protein